MTERGQLEQAITHLEAQRATLGDAVVEAALARGQAPDLDAVVAELLEHGAA